MKKIGAVILVLALCLLATCSALAEHGLIARNEALTAYADGEGHIYLPGNPSAINQASASSIVSIDAYRLLFLSDVEGSGSNLYMIDLETFEESLLISGVYAASLTNEESLYYIPDGDRTQLMRMNPATGVAETVYTATEPIDRLYVSAEGLVFQLVDQAGAMIHVRGTGNF